MSDLLDRDHLVDNFLDRLDAQERRIADLERKEIMKFGDVTGTDYA